MRLTKNPVEWKRTPKKPERFELGSHVIRYPLQSGSPKDSNKHTDIFDPRCLLTKCWANTPWLQQARNSITFIPILPPTVGNMIDNYADMSFKIGDLKDITSLDPTECPCHRIPNSHMWIDDSIGHIRTFDASIMRWGGKGNNFYHRAARKGRDFRPPWCQQLFLQALFTFFDNIAVAFDAILTRLEQAIPAHNTADKPALRKTVTSRLQASKDVILGKANGSYRHRHPLLLPTEAWKRYGLLIETMQKHLTFTRTDKAENTPNTVCTAYYRWNIYTRLTTQGEIRMLGPADTNYTLDAVRLRVWSLIKRHRPDNFPIMCSSGKAYFSI